VIVLSTLGETINTMTLSGLALSVGILVDNATVMLENLERLLQKGYHLRTAILKGAAQVAVPTLVSTLCICIVFLPMFFLRGVSRFLFVPLAEAVMFAVIASYVLALTLVPTLEMYLLGKKRGESRHGLALFQRGFEQRFERIRLGYEIVLSSLVCGAKSSFRCFCSFAFAQRC
jgi:multidrug efflux pump subunit AcrB